MQCPPSLIPARFMCHDRFFTFPPRSNTMIPRFKFDIPHRALFCLSNHTLHLIISRLTLSLSCCLLYIYNTAFAHLSQLSPET